MAKSSKNTGRWKIVEPLGGGGQAEVFTVTDKLDEHQGVFALKRLKNVKRQERFTREIAALRRLNGDPNIVTLVDVDGGEEPRWFVMALGEGSLEELAPPDGYPVERAFELFRLICTGVMALHREGVVHRDLKPENVIVSDGDAKVGDLGLCLIEELPRVTPDWEAIGARYYMAPESEAGRDDDADVRADVYSLGKLLYWLLAGNILPREKLRSPKYALPGKREHQALDEFMGVIENAIAEHRALRTASVEKLLESFEAAVARFENRPERTLSLKKAAMTGRPLSDLLPSLSPVETAMLAELVLDDKVSVTEQEVWSLAAALSERAGHVLGLLGRLDEKTLSERLPEIMARFFDSEKAARSFGQADLRSGANDPRQRILDHVTDNGSEAQLRNAVVGLGLTTMAMKPDLGRLMRGLGEPETWSQDLILAAAMRPYDGRGDDMRRIMAVAGDDVARFNAALQVLALSGDVDPEQAVAELTAYVERHLDSPGFQAKLERLKASGSVEDEAADGDEAAAV